MSRPPSRLVTALDRLLIPGDLLTTVQASSRGHCLLVDRGDQLYYEEAGAGATPLVFLAGAAPASRVFRPQLAHFESSAIVRALALDPRSGIRPTGGSQPSVRYRAHDLDAIARHLDLRDMVLVGWAAGVADALAYVRQFGCERLKGLVLVDWGPRATSLRPEAAWTAVLTAGMPDDHDDTDYLSDLMAIDGIVPVLFIVPDVLREVVAEWADAHTPSAYVVGLDRPASPRRPPAELSALLDRFLAILPVRARTPDRGPRYSADRRSSTGS
jgi:pimeloyl-ACP methyl ester carboxylesterase